MQIKLPFTIPENSYSILMDVGFIALCVLFIYWARKKGGLASLYDLLTTVISIFLSYILASPVTELIVSMASKGNSFMQFLKPFASALVSFLALLILFIIITRLIGLVVKPLLTSIMETFKVTKIINDVLGMVIGFVEGCLISYLILACVITPFFGNVNEVMEETYLTRAITDAGAIVVDVADDLNNSFSFVNSKGIKLTTRSVLANTIVFTLRLYDNHLIKESTMLDLIKNVFAPQINQFYPEIKASDKRVFVELLNKTDLSKTEKAEVKSNLLVAD